MRLTRESEPLQEKVGYKSVIDLGREASVPFPHNLCDYPTKILPQVMGEFAERLSAAGELVLDPCAGGGTVAVECALRQRRSINIDINPYADAIVTDIPYADMIRYSDLSAGLRTIEDYEAFLDALGTAFDEMARVLKPNRYRSIFVAD